jgi:molybdopterin-guanine dinucleotide biosynthesis protein A
LRTSAIILSGGYSRRFGKDKWLINLQGKPLIFHVIEKIVPLVDETIVVTKKQLRKEFVKSINFDIKIVQDEHEVQAPLVGALKGFQKASGLYSVLLPCDAPLISGKAISLLLRMVLGNEAVIPKWPNGYIEPLHAVYDTQKAKRAAKKVIDRNEFKMRDFINEFEKVRFVSTLKFQSFDPNLHTFINVNHPSEFHKIENILRLDDY